MVEINLKVFGHVNTRDTLIAFLTIPFDPKQGATFDEVLDCAPLLHKLQTSTDYAPIEVTVEQYEILMLRLRNGRYEKVSYPLFDLLTYMMSLAPTEQEEQ